MTKSLLRKPRLSVGQIHIRFSSSKQLHSQKQVLPFTGGDQSDHREHRNTHGAEFTAANHRASRMRQPRVTNGILSIALINQDAEHAQDAEHNGTRPSRAS